MSLGQNELAGWVRSQQIDIHTLKRRLQQDEEEIRRRKRELECMNKELKWTERDLVGRSHHFD